MTTGLALTGLPVTALLAAGLLAIALGALLLRLSVGGLGYRRDTRPNTKSRPGLPSKGEARPLLQEQCLG